MSKFKVGAKVTRTASSKHPVCDVVQGDTITVLRLKNNLYFRAEETGIADHFLEYYELAWQPKPGEIIEVNYDDKGWKKREFVAMAKDQFACIDPSDKDDTYDCYKVARPIKATVTIIKESTGEKVEISQESSTSIFG